MKENKFAVSMNDSGELLQEHIHDITARKYKADSLLFSTIFPYLLMAVCVVIDLAFFCSLFMRVSHDKPILVAIEVAGFAFAADVVPAYAGTLKRQIDEGISRSRHSLYRLIAIPIVALIMNTILRTLTIRLDNPNGTVQPETIALTIASIVIPIFTSLTNFELGCIVYDPIKIKMYREEMAIDEMKDYIRRLEVIKQECDNFNANRLKEMDDAQLRNAKKKVINDALLLYADVRLQLAEYLGDPASTNILSKPHCDEIFDRLSIELQLLEMKI